MNSLSAIKNKSLFWKGLFGLFFYMFFSTLYDVVSDPELYFNGVVLVLFIIGKGFEILILLALLGIILEKYFFNLYFWKLFLYLFPLFSVSTFVYTLFEYEVTTNEMVFLTIIGACSLLFFLIPLFKYYDNFGRQNLRKDTFINNRK